MTRRRFAKVAGAGTAALTSSLFTGKLRGANDRISVGVIGLGIMGYGHLRHLVDNRNNWQINVTAGCDIFGVLRERASDYVQKETGQALDTYNDFQEMLQRKDIDAVFIATPDHWHALMTVEAAKAGKDIYVQKPISVDTYESRMMVQAVRKYGRVCQVGTQQPSWNSFAEAIEHVRSGILGKITKVETFNHGANIFPGPFNLLPAEPPAGLDWQMWLGPAPQPPFGPSDEFNPDIFGLDFDIIGSPTKSAYWQDLFMGGRRILLYGTWRIMCRPFGGLQTDWGVHWTDIVLRAMQVTGPIRVSSHGGNFIYKDGRELPDTQITTWEFSDFLCTFELRTGSGRSAEGLPKKFEERNNGIFFRGSEATLFINRTGYVILPESGKNIDLPSIEVTNRDGSKETIIGNLYNKRGDDAHVKNFFDCMRSRQEPIAPIEGGRYATDMCIAAMAAYWTKETLDWDPAAGTTGKTATHPYLNLQYRKPWKLEI